MLEELGSDAHIFFPVEAQQVVIEDAMTDQPEDEATLLADEKERTLFVARVDARTDARVGRHDSARRRAVAPLLLLAATPARA